MIIDIYVLLSEALRSVRILVYSCQIWSFSSESFLYVPLLDSVKRILIMLILWIYFVSTCHDLWIALIDLPVWGCCSCSPFLLTWRIHEEFIFIAFSFLKKRLFWLFDIKRRELTSEWRLVFSYEIFISFKNFLTLPLVLVYWFTTIGKDKVDSFCWYLSCKLRIFELDLRHFFEYNCCRIFRVYISDKSQRIYKCWIALSYLLLQIHSVFTFKTLILCFDLIWHHVYFNKIL